MKDSEGAICKIWPENWCFGPVCNLNPARFACELGMMVNIHLVHLLVVAGKLAVDTLEVELAQYTLGELEKIDTYIFTYATFHSLSKSDEWNFRALETINRNVVTQHSEMRYVHCSSTKSSIGFLSRS